MKNKSSILGHFAIISSGSLMNMIIGVFTTPVITRLVDPTSYGQAAIFILYCNIAVMILGFGMDQSLVRYFYNIDSDKYRREIVRCCIKLPLLSTIAAIFVFLFLVGVGVFKYDFDFGISIVLCFSVLFHILNRFSFLVVRLSYKSKLYSFLNVLHKLLYALLVVVGVLLIGGDNLYILTLSTVASIAITTIMGVWSNKDLWFGNVQYKETPTQKELLAFGSPFILSFGIVTLFQSVSQFTLKYYCTFEEVGTFAAAMTLVHIFNIIQTSINALWAPMATENFVKTPDNTAFYEKGFKYISILMFAMGFVLISMKDILALFLGEKFRVASHILPCLIFVPIMYTISEVTVMGVNFMKKSNLHIYIALLSLVVNLVFNIALVPKYGCTGAAISTAIAYISFFSFRTFFSNRCYKVNFALVKFYIITIITLVYAILDSFYDVTVINILGCVLSFGVLLLLFGKDMIECKTYILDIVKRRKNK